MASFSHIVSAALTDVGNRRKNNEDAYGAFPSVGIFCVADGMGGGDDGEIASAATVQSVEHIAPALVPPEGSAFALGRVADAVAHAVDLASDWIFRRTQSKRLRGCGSTFVGICFDAADPHAAVALHAGDSRLYRLRDGTLWQITADHSAASLIGASSDAEVNPMFRSMVLRAVGIASAADLERTSVEVAAGDRFLLCSDGLSHMVADDRLQEVCVANERAEDAARALVAAAKEAGGLDNVTVIVLDVGALPAPAPEMDGPNEIGFADVFFGETYPDGSESPTGDPTAGDDMMTCSASADGAPSAVRVRSAWWAGAIGTVKGWLAKKKQLTP